MEGSKLGLLIGRFIQLACAAIVLAMAASTYNGVHLRKDLCDARNEKNVNCGRLYSRYPSTLGFTAFVGAFGLLDAFVGLIAAFVSFVPFLVALGGDALAAIFYLAGGINFAILYSHPAPTTEGRWRPCGSGRDYDLLSPCSRFTAATAFMFIGFLATIMAAALGFIAKRSGSIRGH
ncbi:uncharacterized protein MYCFIDRAFT_78244 [Pseudocercospora fijiensis CIRAD86]|uniref:MARVEL domain-containing protein n=1 Tax=Pseudocercospora fijiensis (strain CIRAD86) TaxID=383855 RepID=M3ASQ9_PSEFD|nr:uncharacterized protein MYCFIDRAFT_78244 [Pseudocercospora fijiensis CIRAD86]EME80532.1 hypothetical protein MYCFIDRAFT_78244 [Pseudocercospora fijiensis CIRAD86]